MNPPTFESIESILSGTATTAERETVEAWYQSRLKEAPLTGDMTLEEKENVANKMWAVIVESIKDKQNHIVNISG